MGIPRGLGHRVYVVAVLMTVAALGLYGEVVSADESAVPRGDERVKSVWLFDVASDAPFCADAALADSAGLYVAGHAWSEASGERAWLWRIDRDGERLWDKEVARPERSEPVRVVALVPGGAIEDSSLGQHEALLIYSRGTKTFLRTCSLAGEFADETLLTDKGSASGAIPLRDGNLLVFGTESPRRDGPAPAWVARFDRSGRESWRLPLDPAVAAKRIAPWAPPVLAPGQYHINQLAGGVEMDDGSTVLVGVTGEFNKFGQGPSQLWLVRVTGEGKFMSQTLVDGGRLGGGSTCCIVQHGDGVLVPYTTDQLPPIGNVPLDAPPSFGNRLAYFGARLEKAWEKPLPNSGMPGRVAICGPEPFVMLSAEPGSVLVRAVGGEGDEVWRATVTAPRSSAFPVAVARQESGAGVRESREVVAVCNYLRHPETGEIVRPRPQVMVITMTGKDEGP